MLISSVRVPVPIENPIQEILCYNTTITLQIINVFQLLSYGKTDGEEEREKAEEDHLIVL